MKKLMCAVAAACGIAAMAETGPGTYFVPKSGTANVAADAPRNEKAVARRTVAFLGGSITEMHGFRPRVMAMLRGKYPNVDFVEIAAGLSSTCSDTGAFRIGDDVLKIGVPDLFIVEEAANDDQDGHFDRTRCIRGLEGIVRQVRAANPACEIVVGLMVTKKQYDQLSAGQIPVSYAAGADVAAHYGAALADVGTALVKSAKAGGMSWKEYRDCHPSPEGCDFGAKVVMDAIGQVFDPMRQPAAKPLPPPMDVFSYFRARTVPREEMDLGDGWRISAPDWKRIPGNKRDYFCRGEAVWSETPGAVLEVRFCGSAIGAMLTAGPDAGDLEVSVDGGEWTLRRLRAEYGDLHYPYTEIFADGLDAKRHSVRLRVAKAERKGKVCTAIRLHRICVNGIR